MSEVDERVIAELAKEPPRVLRGAAGPGALEEARKVLKRQALMGGSDQGLNAREGRGS